jgi:4-hydroxy-3-methylbut-2-enyl diphosphate reductase
MNINLSRYAGFCDGVSRAYQMVEKLARSKKTKRPIFVLGSLVHNSEVVKRVEKMGIRKVELGDLKKAGLKSGTLIITAHGVGPKVYELAKNKKTEILDTTCPRVVKVQRLARIFNQRGWQVLIIGEKKHKEVKGICQWCGRNTRVIETLGDLKKLRLAPNKNAVVISQTTQNRDLVKAIVKKISELYKDVKIIDTLCATTHNRQKEVKKMARENDLMIIIGSPQSSNSTRLWEIAKQINKRSYFIENSQSLDKKWLTGAKNIGVTAGASTPEWIIIDVMRTLKKAAKK